MKKYKFMEVTVEERPIKTVLDQDFVYRKWADVQQIWRSHGWVPPSEYRTDYEFGKNREVK